MDNDRIEAIRRRTKKKTKKWCIKGEEEGRLEHGLEQLFIQRMHSKVNNTFLYFTDNFNDILHSTSHPISSRLHCSLQPFIFTNFSELITFPIFFSFYSRPFPSNLKSAFSIQHSVSFPSHLFRFVIYFSPVALFLADDVPSTSKSLIFSATAPSILNRKLHIEHRLCVCVSVWRMTQYFPSNLPQVCLISVASFSLLSPAQFFSAQSVWRSASFFHCSLTPPLFFAPASSSYLALSI